MRITEIQKKTAAFHKIELSSMIGPSKVSELVEARQLSIYMCKNHGNWTDAEIERAHNRKGVMKNVITSISNKCNTDPNFYNRVRALRGFLGLDSKKQQIIQDLWVIKKKLERGDYNNLSVDQIIESIENQL